MECKRLPIDYEIKDFSLKIILLNQKFWFSSFLKTPKNLPDGQVTSCKKQTILINMIHYLINELIFQNSFHNPISIN